MNAHRTRGFTLIELLVVIASIALLAGVLIPAMAMARKRTALAACMGNQRTLSMAWVMYAGDNDGALMCNGACYDTPTDMSPWVHRPKDSAGNNLVSPALAGITQDDRYRGIRAGTMWPYVEDVDVYHCPGDNRKNTQTQPRDCFRSYSISDAFGAIQDSRRDDWRRGQYYNKLSMISDAARYYVFVEEEHSGSNYGENEGGWHLPFDNNANRLTHPASWTFSDPLASYHVKSSTFGFADGHAEKHTWRDQRTLEFISANAANPSAHSGIRTASPDNEDLRWLIEHFMPQKKMQ